MTEQKNRLEDKGFASTNVVLGIGSYSLQFVTRDTHGSAQTLKSEKLVSKYLKIQLLMGIKKSAKGLLMVYEEDGKVLLKTNVLGKKKHKVYFK
jgi:nicotinamide phosphoribosyltransferase